MRRIAGLATAGLVTARRAYRGVSVKMLPSQSVR